MTPFSEYTRLQPTPSALRVILKNTHFPDDLLSPDKLISMKVLYNAPSILLNFSFQEPMYDFTEILSPGDFQGERSDWLKKQKIEILLSLADTVFTDKLTKRTFTPDLSESALLRAHLLLT